MADPRHDGSEHLPRGALGRLAVSLAVTLVVGVGGRLGHDGGSVVGAHCYGLVVCEGGVLVERYGCGCGVRGCFRAEWQRQFEFVCIKFEVLVV